MNISPYTPVPVLRRMLRVTYGSQALSAFVSAVTIKMAMLVFDLTLVFMEDTQSLLMRLFYAGSGGISIAMFLRAVYNCVTLFLDAGKARINLKWMIAKKQSQSR